MGIYDRDYYRKEGPSFLGYLASTGLVCKWIVVINIVVYVLQLLTHNQNEWLTRALAMNTQGVFERFEIWRLLTAAFLHHPDNPWHLIWNMLFLWWLGPDMEDLYGHREFLVFYLIAGIVSSLFWGLTELFQPPAWQSTMLGASGAITAVSVLSCCHYPFRTILLFFVIPVPHWLLLVIFLGGDLFYFLRGLQTQTAVAAHLGGAAFGFFYYKWDWRFLYMWARFVELMRLPRKPRLRVYQDSPIEPARSRPNERRNEQLEAKTDAVLAKLHTQGIDSLTPEEREILQRASEEYKKKRT